MKAKDMFEKLGYEREKFIKNYGIDKNFINYRKGKIHIVLSNFSVPISICKFKDSLFFNKSQDITIEELKAINQQIKELNWDNE